MKAAVPLVFVVRLAWWPAIRKVVPARAGNVRPEPGPAWSSILYPPAVLGALAVPGINGNYARRTAVFFNEAAVYLDGAKDQSPVVDLCTGKICFEPDEELLKVVQRLRSKNQNDIACAGHGGTKARLRPFADRFAERLYLGV